MSGDLQDRAAGLQAILYSMADAVFVLDGAGNVVDVNPRAVELAGFCSRDDALRPLDEYRRFLRAEYLDGRLVQPEECAGARAMRGETFRGLVQRVQTWDGREVVVEMSAAPVLDADGQVRGGVVVARDVTDLEWARSRDSVVRVATAVARSLTLKDLVDVVLDETGSALGADAVALFVADEARQELQLLGHRNQLPEIVERTRIIPYDAPRLSAYAISAGTVQVLENVTRAPSEFSISRELGERFGLNSLIAVPLLVRGHTIGVMTYATRSPRHFLPRELETIRTIGDIIAIGLENARLYDEAHEERRRLMAVIENSPEGILFFEAPSGRTILRNRAAEEIIGRSLEHEVSIFVHPSFQEVYSADGSAYPVDDLPPVRALCGEAALGEELLIRTPDGCLVPILVNAAPIRDSAGHVTGAVMVFQDISRIKELERLREEFVSVIAHDLRAPVTVIQGYADFLTRHSDRFRVAKTAVKGLESIALSARRLNTMVTDLLDASRIEARRLALQKEKVNLDVLARSLIERMMRASVGHPIRLNVIGVAPVTSADPVRLEQILTNLLINAAKFSPSACEIVVTIEPGCDEALVSVTDQGSGIPTEELPRLFERFYRTTEGRGVREGLGLGLYITRGLVEAHGGRIWASSQIGKGSTFTFTLPV